MKIAILAPVAWRTPPTHYGPWEQIASNLTEGLVKAGHDVTLFASSDSVTQAKLDAIVEKGYEEDKTQDPKVLECLHISNAFEKADQFDLIHNHFDFLPLTWSKFVRPPVVTTIHGFSSPKILPVYKKYNKHCHYISISNSDRSPELDYLATVYNGINTNEFEFQSHPGGHLLFFGRIHPDKGTAQAIEIALKSKKALVIAGIIQDQEYFQNRVKPFLGDQIKFIGQAGPDQRNQLMGKAAALLHPINFNEPFGMSVAEAMLCGTPVVAFNRGSMPELVRHGKTGFLVSSVDEAVTCIRNLSSINRKDCRDWASSQFSSEKMVSNYMEAYRMILEEKR